MTFYHCKTCGNLVVKTVVGAGELVCCGEPMTALTANTVDAAVEKHVPAFHLDGDLLSVTVGSVPHPMTPEHYIQMIAVQQDDTVQFVSLAPTDPPSAAFRIDGDKPFVVYEYCNLHGLWMSSHPDGFLFEETVCSAEFPQGCIDS